MKRIEKEGLRGNSRKLLVVAPAKISIHFDAGNFLAVMAHGTKVTVLPFPDKTLLYAISEGS